MTILLLLFLVFFLSILVQSLKLARTRIFIPPEALATRPINSHVGGGWPAVEEEVPPGHAGPSEHRRSR